MTSVSKALTILQDDGLLSLAYQGTDYYGWYKPIWNTITSRNPIGTNVFDRDWELLIILDTCRVDALRQASRSIGQLDAVEQIWSVGSMSAEWMLNTFTQDHREKISETAFISGNIWSHRIFDEQFHKHTDHDYDYIHTGAPAWNPVSSDAFAHYETVCSFGSQDKRLHPEGQHIPHILTDRTINVARNKNWERLIVHYTLPHLNHIAGALEWRTASQTELMSGELDAMRELSPEEKSFAPAQQGEVTAGTIYDNFMENLQLALQYVEILLENVNAETAIISADHGEGFGENGVWSHPFGCPFPPVKTVPWATVTATDEETYQPEYSKLERPPTENELKQHLEAMGYY